MNLFGGEDTPYEGLHAVVSLGVKPWFDAFVGARSGGKDTGDIRMGERPFDVDSFLFLMQPQAFQ